MAQTRTLMVVHAHPDDEAFGTAGTLARYSAEGVQTCLVTATRGEVGEIHDPELSETEARPRLGQIREEELRRAAEILGVTHLDFLGYEDSGMAGTPENANPRCFHQSSLDEATGRLVALIRRYRPQVIVTYGEDGGYNHPDHVRTHLVTAAAFQDAGNPLRFAETGEAWQPSKFYATRFSRRAMTELWQELRARGRAWPWAEERQDEAPDWGSPDDQLRTAIDVRAYVSATRRALRQHRTQFDPDGPWMQLEDDLAVIGFGTEYFELIRSLVDAPEREDDLFMALRGDD